VAKNLVTRAAAGMDLQRQPRMPKMLRDVLTYHASTLDAARAASEASVGELVLTHLVPPPANVGGDAPFLQGVADIFHGKVEVAKDGMRFDLEARKE
jgi:ribonuclease Z